MLAATAEDIAAMKRVIPDSDDEIDEWIAERKRAGKIVLIGKKVKRKTNVR